MDAVTVQHRREIEQIQTEAHTQGVKDAGPQLDEAERKARQLEDRLQQREKVSNVKM